MIQQVGAEFAESLAALHARAFARPWSARDIAAMLANANALAILSGGDVADGFAIAWVVAGEAELLTIAVVPETRRRGVGTGLLKEICRLARARGAGVLHLEVAEDNSEARALYQKLGFATAGRRHGYYARDDAEAADAIVLRLSLS